MAADRREIYRSPNGDCWYLECRPADGHGYVVHEPNEPSGGKPSHLEVSEFLGTNANGPEHQALLRLIGSLAAIPPA